MIPTGQPEAPFAHGYTVADLDHVARKAGFVSRWLFLPLAQRIDLARFAITEHLLTLTNAHSITTTTVRRGQRRRAAANPAAASRPPPPIADAMPTTHHEPTFASGTVTAKRATPAPTPTHPNTPVRASGSDYPGGGFACPPLVAGGGLRAEPGDEPDTPARSRGAADHANTVHHPNRPADSTNVDPHGLETVGKTLAAATEMRRLHVANPAGWCLGCLTGWNRLVLIGQCTQLQWANTVHTQYDRANQTETGVSPMSATCPAVTDERG